MTNEAALELRKRLRDLGVGVVSNLFVGTVHSFALACVVGPFATAAGLGDLAVSNFASTKEFDQCFDAAFERSAFAYHERANVRETTSRARQRLDFTGNLLLGGPKIAAFAQSLQTELENHRLYDFQDLVRHAVTLVEEYEWVRRVLAATYPLIFVDEYQDLAPGLDRIVRALTLDSEFDTTLFAVGDPDQAIYAFSGAKPQLLLELAAEPKVETIPLQINYRNGQEIIDVARRLTDGQPVSGRRMGGPVTIRPVAGGEQDQAEQAAALIRGLIEDGAAPDDIAVLASWSGDRDRCAQQLRDVGVPVFSRSDDNWRMTPVTALLESMAAWSLDKSGSGVSLSDLLDTLRSVTRQVLDHISIRSVVEVLLSTYASQSAALFVEQIVVAALETIVDCPRINEDQIELGRMRDYLQTSSVMVAELGARARAPGHVLASTIHGAKGLEFDQVVVLGADDAAMYGFSPEIEEIAEARRRFYVSLTRARDSVQVFYPAYRISRAGKPYCVAPTPFISELGLERG
jgi:DNA helicase-2/ATP-dependent DNA helicase PcrA